MTISNALAGIAVDHLDEARQWYEKLLDLHGTQPMPEVVEWSFPGGGGLQIFEDHVRAGLGSVTLVVDDIAGVRSRLSTLGLTVVRSTDSDTSCTTIIKDPSDNQLVFAQALDPTLAR